MKVLVIGSGGREHALAWKLAESPGVKHVYVAPGNGGTELASNLENLPITDFEELAGFAEREGVVLTVVGPDAALADGVVNLFRSRGLAIFGPTREAAELEWSKDFAKGFMQRHRIPTAAYATFSDAAQAHAYVDRQGAPIVVKADGLAAGKGVVVALTPQEAHEAIDSMLEGDRFGAAGSRVVVEEFMQGEEASFFVVSDGKDFVTLSTAQDHKRLLDGDKGPNTGGMGSYAPAPVVSPDVRAKVLSRIVRPTLQGMASEGRPYTGFLYVGLMIDAAGEPRVVEFNARMGDPETQVVMLRLKSDLLPLLQTAARGALGPDVELEWDRRAALTVILASQGYPERPRKGDVIHGLSVKPQDDVVVFHAGTAVKDGQLVTSGGRVLCVTALGESIKQAQHRAYEAAATIGFDGMQLRRDIGWRAIKPVK